MATKKETLLSFVENYIQNKVKSAADSYAGWVMANGKNSGKIYSDSMRAAELGGRLNSGRTGAGAEALYSLGLSDSGYSDYVKNKAYSDMKKDFSLAEESYRANEKSNMTGYLKNLDTEKKKLTSAVNSIESAGLLKYGEAYDYAVMMGLNEADASAVAKTGSEIVRKKLKNNVMKLAVNKRFTRTETREYALSLGLSEEDAAELSEYAENINAFINSSDYEGGYLDYLKNQN